MKKYIMYVSGFEEFITIKMGFKCIFYGYINGLLEMSFVLGF